MPAVQGHTAGGDRVLPLQNEDGLIAYECPACSYVTSVIWPAKKRQTDDRRHGP